MTIQLPTTEHYQLTITLTLLHRDRSAPLRTKTSTVSRDPLSAAKCSGLLPSCGNKRVQVSDKALMFSTCTLSQSKFKTYNFVSFFLNNYNPDMTINAHLLVISTKHNIDMITCNSTCLNTSQYCMNTNTLVPRPKPSHEGWPCAINLSHTVT